MKRFLIFVFILLTCSMFGQVKLRQLERDSIKFSVPTPKDQIIIAGDTSYSQRYIPGLAWLDSLGVNSVQDYYISNDTLYLVTSDSTFALVITHPANLDNDPANEIQVLSGTSGTTSNTVLNLSNGGGTYTITEGSGIDFTSETSAGFTITATDPSTTNELQTLTENLSFIDITGSGTAAMEITSTKDRPVSRTYHANEGATLKPFWADIENSWYLANERFESVSNTCSIDDLAMYNMTDNSMRFIVDSCTFSLIISNTSTGVTYPDGYLYIVPYANQNIGLTDSIKVRTRDKDGVWTTPYYGPVNIVDAGSDSYGWCYVNSSFYIREYEITYYGDIEISEIEFYYNRDNLDIPVFLKNMNNILYKEITLYESLRDQFGDAGTSSQVLRSDGDLVYWDNETLFDTVPVYNYINALDTTLFSLKNDTIYNKGDGNRLQLTNYGGGNYNNRGTEFAMFSSDGTIEGYSIDSVDISDNNEERVYDTYIENGFQNRSDNFNFSEYRLENNVFENNQSKNDLTKLTQIKTTAIGYDVTGVAYDNGFIYVFDNTNQLIKKYDKTYTLKESWAAHGTDIEEFIFFNNGYDMIQFSLKNKTIYHYSRVSLDSLAHFSYESSLNLNTISNIPITVGNRFHSMVFLDDDEFIINDYQNHYKIRFKFQDKYDLSSIVYVDHITDAEIMTAAVIIDNIYYDFLYSGIIKKYSYSGIFSMSGLTLDTTTATVFGNAGSFSASWDDEKEILYVASTSPDKITEWIFKGRDTTFTNIPEKLDTSNYYSYSIEIEGNNVDTIRTGIATWLDGNVSYQWCTGDTLYSGWYRHELDFKATEHDSIKPVFVIADTTSIRNVRLFLKQYQSETFDDSAIQTRIDSVITVVDDHKDTDLDIDPTNEFQDLTFASNIIGLTNSAVTFDLSGYLDNTDAQDISTSGAAGNITIDNGSTLNLNVNDADASITNEGVLSMNTDLANTTFSINSNSSGSVPMYFTEETSVTGNNRAVDLERSGNSITFNLKDADELESITITPGADRMLVWDATDSDWKQTLVSALPGDGTGTDDQGLVIVSAAAGTINTENSALGAIDLTSLIQQQVVQESTTVGTGFDLSGYQIVADFNEFTTDASPEGDEFIIMYDVSGVTHEKIDIDDLATYIGSGELTTVGTGFSLAGYQINADFDAFTSDNTFSDTDEVVYLSFTTHKKGTLAGLGSYMQANWGDGTGTDDQAIYYYLSGSTPALRLDGTSTGMEFDAGEGLVSSGFEEGSLDRILYQHDWTEFNVLSSGVTTSDYLLVLDGTDEARMQISYLATLIGGADGNGLWDSGNNNSLMAENITGYVNDYMAFYNGTGSTLIWYVDDAATDFVGIRTSTQSNGAYLNVGGPVDIAGNTWIDGFLTLGNLSGVPTSLLGSTSGGIVTNDITIGDGLDFTSGTLSVDNEVNGVARYYGSLNTVTSTPTNITVGGSTDDGVLNAHTTSEYLEFLGGSVFPNSKISWSGGFRVEKSVGTAVGTVSIILKQNTTTVETWTITIENDGRTFVYVPFTALENIDSTTDKFEFHGSASMSSGSIDQIYYEALARYEPYD